MSNLRHFLVAAVMVLSSACVACVAPQQEPPQPAAVPPTEEVGDPPAGDSGLQPAGTLSWEELSVRMVGRQTSVGLRIDVTTLSDEALAVAAPDIRVYLSDLRSRIPDLAQGERRPTAFLVGYTGFEKEVDFDPTLLQIDSDGSTFYPVTIVPISTNFDRRVLDLYETVYGVYLFEPGIDQSATLEFRYGELSSGAAWRTVVDGIQRAQARGGR